MNLITTIEDFKLKYDNTDKFIEYNNLSDVVLEYYVENYDVNWWGISINQTLSESFIDKYNDKVNWFYISSYQTLSESFIDRYSDKVSWTRLLNNTSINMSYAFIVEHLYKFSLYKVGTNNRYINKLIEEYPEKYKIDKLAYEFNS